MKLFTLLYSILFTLFTTSSLACKCISKADGKAHNEETRRACRYAHGRIVEHEQGSLTDCNAHSMSQKLSDFHFRCETYNSRSDCRHSVVARRCYQGHSRPAGGHIT
ncbi:hypothetical protein P171DRAFT_483859 [Karstenula rhodostoma CBS 690.94]|uniref:Secreted protein n=1 Tax=Karstenula rhodostoma CBS 690.94 TaxID=1392251 RepID=A0A9P4PM12_9PLEO|nr:hypothetical protein P171DRAFT_483859 [Karstenula rhodostoma CBS 690.94]